MGGQSAEVVVMTTEYRDIKVIVERLVAEGVRPSRKRVRRELGDHGSYHTIGKLIDQAMGEVGLHAPGEDSKHKQDMLASPAIDMGDTEPEPDPADVASHLAALRSQTAFVMAQSHLKAFIAACRCLPEPLEVVSRELSRQHQQRQMGLPFGMLTSAPHRPSWEALTDALPRVLKAAEAFLRDVEKAMIVIEEGHQHGNTPTPAA